nr:DoxX family protein [Streptomyces sp. HB202]
MAVLRRVARPLLAAKFIRDGIAAVRDPALPDPPEDARGEREAPALATRLPFLPEDPEQLVRLQGAVQLGAGVLLALGRAPRLASAALAVTLVSSALTAGGRGPDDGSGARRLDLLTDLSLLGGLLIAAGRHPRQALARVPDPSDGGPRVRRGQPSCPCRLPPVGERGGRDRRRRHALRRGRP